MTDGTKRDIHWAKPEDIFIDPDQPLPEFGGFHDGGFNVVRADGSISFFPENVGENFMRTMFTPSGGDIIEMELEPESKSNTDDNGK